MSYKISRSCSNLLDIMKSLTIPFNIHYLKFGNDLALYLMTYTYHFDCSPLLFFLFFVYHK